MRPKAAAAAGPGAWLAYDFAIPELGKAVPYGIYDVSANAGFVNVGISADTRVLRREHPPLVVRDRRSALSKCKAAADQRRLRRQQRLPFAWKRELQVLADELRIEIFHGTSSRVDDWRGGGRSQQ